MRSCLSCQVPIADGATCPACEAALLATSRKQIADFYRQLAGQAWDAESRAEMLACARKAENLTQNEVDAWDRKLLNDPMPRP